MLFARLIVVLILYLYQVSKGEHTCIHGTLQPNKTRSIQEYPPYDRKRASGSNIRISVDISYLNFDDSACDAEGSMVLLGSNTGQYCSQGYSSNCFYECNTTDILTGDKRALLLSRLLPNATGWLQDTLLLHDNIVGKLVLDSSSCNGIEVPAKYNSVYYGGGGGVANTDLLLIVTARPVLGSVIAFAGI
jgi:hypothetical protein